MVQERSEISDEHKWDIQSMYTSLDDARREMQELETELEEFQSLNGKVAENPENLEKSVKLKLDISRRLMHISRYANMRRDQDTRDQEAQQLLSEVKALKADFNKSSGFVKPEIVEAGREKINELREKSSLENLDHYFNDIFRMKDHILSSEKEMLVASLGDVLDAPHETYSTFTNADLSFPEVEKPSGETVELTQSNFVKFQQSADRKFRKTTYEKLYETFGEYKNTITTTLQKNVKRNVRIAEIRGFDSAREASLKPNNIPETVYDNLIEVVRENSELLERHAELKRKSLGVEELKMYDLYMPIATSDSPEIPFERAKELILEALKPLGEEYVEKVRKGLEEEKWVDLYENKGKRSGAYSGGSYDSKPFILMNYQDDINSMYTLIHELGHSMHSKLTNNSQPYVYSDYTIFQAEVASTTNEALLTRYLIQNVEDEELKRHALSHSLENFRSTLFRQTMFSEMEKWLHNELEAGRPVTADRVSEKYGELKKSYYPNADIDDNIEREWMRIPHFYYNFYVYQYATGISAGNALAENIVEEGPEDYLEFLKTGGSMYSIESLKQAGADMSSTKPIEEAMNKYEKHLEDMESMVN